MFREIFRFEWRLQTRSPLLWVFASIFFLGALALMSSPAVKVGNAVGNVHVNAPMVVAVIGTLFAFLATLFVVVFVTRALLRDFDQRTAETIFSTPVSHGAYLGGRTLAGFVAVLLVMAAALAGAFLGTLMPWVDSVRLGPVMATPWLWTFGVMLVPDVIFVTALLFALAAATRSFLATFIGVIALLVLRTVATSLMHGIGSHVLPALIDPYGAQAVAAATRYWTAHAYNTQVPSLTGVVLGNRALWLGVSVVLFAVGAFLFRSRREGIKLRLWRRRRTRTRVEPPSLLKLPQVGLRHGAGAHWRQVLSGASMDLRHVLRGALFIIMLLLSMAMLVAVLLTSGKAYGTPLYPVTHVMLHDIHGAFSLFLIIVLAFYVGEMVWRDRALRVHVVSDALPAPRWTALVGKAIAVIVMTWIFFGVGELFTIGFQLFHGYTHLQLGLYASDLLLQSIGFVLLGVLALVLQCIANNKYVGYLLFVAVLVGIFVLDLLHFSDGLYLYANGPDIPYSDLNGYGHFLTAALWFDLYWALAAVALVVLAVLFRKHGTDSGHRWRSAFARLAQPAMWVTLAASLVAFVLVGGWIFYNTHVLHTYTSHSHGQQLRADYEKLYGKYNHAPQPRITAVKTRVAIYPYKRKLRMHVHYKLVNKHKKPIDKLYLTWDTGLPPSHLKFAAHTTVKKDNRIGFSIFKLKQPLAPGASMSFDFDVNYTAHGFKDSAGGMDYMLVHNGTFFSSGQVLPNLGYNSRYQLTSKKDRRKYGLPPAPRVPPLSQKPAKRGNNLISNDADWIHFDAVVSTAADQTALAPGALQKTWVKDGRRYFHYHANAPILDFFAFLSGKWKVKTAHWHGVRISIYYNPAHAWNVDDMIASAKDSLRYYTSHYSPYQFHYLRIIEFPDYRGYAQSFAGTIPFSEATGFIADVKGKGSINYPYYVTAHEIGHQWWAHQVIGAYMQGVTVLDESLAQYSSLMVMKHHYGANAMRKFLKYELDKYLTGRITDQHETPLGKVAGQSYIRYNKASVIFYALQDYIGEDVIDSALRKLLHDFAFKGPPYPTSKNLVGDIKSAAGPQWNTLIDDSFWKITLFDNRVVSATAKKLTDGKYKVTIKVHAAKYYANAKGKQTKAKMNIPVDIGVFAKASNGVEGDEKVLYLKKRKLASGDSTITVTVSGKPYQAGIDPYNELVDRNSADNRKKVVVE